MVAKVVIFRVRYFMNLFIVINYLVVLVKKQMSLSVEFKATSARFIQHLMHLIMIFTNLFEEDSMVMVDSNYQMNLKQVE